jgi:hypothetical protein
VVRGFMRSRNLLNEEALAKWGAVAPKQLKKKGKKFPWARQKISSSFGALPQNSSPALL